MHSAFARYMEVADSRRVGPRQHMRTAASRGRLPNQPCSKRGERVEKRLNRELAASPSHLDVTISVQHARAARKKPTQPINYPSNYK